MRKRVVISVVSAGILLIGALGANSNDQSTKLDAVQTNSAASQEQKVLEKVIPTCDGTDITTSCIFEDVSYKTFIYHPAVPEKTHTEEETTYREEVTGYCTLCYDGTYSPSCATGRGACSHHGGVAQWNAPVSRKVPVTSTRTVVDAPAQEAFYEKVIE